MMNQAAGHPSESSDNSTSGASAETTKTATGSPRTITIVSPSGTSLGISIPSSIGDVKIEAELGRGGMGIVFRGSDSVLHRSVAVKFLPFLSANKDDPKFERFFGGARAEAIVRHPKIVVVHAAGLASGIPYLIMDHIDGLSLHELLRRSGRLSLAVAIKVMSDVAEAATALHHRDVIHQDFKPANVLLDQDGRIFVTDFGLASLRQESVSSTSAAGTPAYMAPELFEGRASPQSDVYAMGIMLYEMLAGRLPFTGDHQAIRKQHQEAALPLDELTKSVPESIIDILKRATHKNALFRYKQAEHFFRALRNSIVTEGLLRQGSIELKQLILARDQSAPAPKAIQADDHSPSSSYFDRIADIAEKKRTSRHENRNVDGNTVRADPSPSVRDDCPPTPAVEQTPTASADGPLAFEVLCMQCGYNLFGRTTNSRCPECSTEVVVSLRADRLLFAPKHWIKRLLIGLSIINWTLGIFLWLGIPLVFLGAEYMQVVFAAVVGLSYATGFYWENRWSAIYIDAHTLIDALYVLSYLFVIALVEGVSVLTVKETQALGTSRKALFRQAARVMSLLLICVLLARVVYGYFFLFLSISGMIFSIAHVAAVIGSVVACLLYLAELAYRIPNVRLARSLRHMAILITTVVVLGVALAAGAHRWIQELMGTEWMLWVYWVYSWDEAAGLTLWNTTNNTNELWRGVYCISLVSLVLVWLRIRELRRAIKRLITGGQGRQQRRQDELLNIPDGASNRSPCEAQLPPPPA